MLEEGEIQPIALPEPVYGPFDLPKVDTTGGTHSPAIEWPGDTESTPELLPYGDTTAHEPAAINAPAPSASLRLLVQHTSILRKKQRIALVDGYTQIEIGRDIATVGSNIPRIRLKEMEVSKLHTTIYWDQDRMQWSVVDMGSKHGTFIQSSAAPPLGGSSAQSLNERGFRLSAPRVASMPRALHHLDRMTVGGTTFAVHIHEDRTPCAACSPQGDEEIPLFLHRAAGASTAASSSKKRKLDDVAPGVNTSDPTASRDRDPRKALAILKRTLLSSKNPTRTPSSSASGSGSRGQTYVDRSARRRALHPEAQGIHSASTPPGAASADRSTAPSPSVSALPALPPPPPPAPLSASNIGHRLLVKQGWQPRTALREGSGEGADLTAPLDPTTTVGRAGIGVPARVGGGIPTVVHGGDWRDAGKRRRWGETGVQ